MLITVMKPDTDILPLITGQCVVIICEGCREVCFPDADAALLIRKLQDCCSTATVITTGYICNPGNLLHQSSGYKQEINTASSLIVLSCGAGVQTVASNYTGKRIIAACDTYPLPGYQGLTPSGFDCAQCEQCYLNSTGGICPVTACSKSLLNGPCGGACNGKCEADSDMPCGWELINKRLAQLHTVQITSEPVKIRSYYSGI